MIKGFIVMEDTKIEFSYSGGEEVDVFIYDSFKNLSENLVIKPEYFFSALSIAVHMDGMPDAEKDYPDAEKAMGKIRWIP
jgi:hypothetical protein